MRLTIKANAPIVRDYRPDTDVSGELDHKFSSLYQFLIGSLRWMLEMGRIDIAREVSMLSSFLAMPREGHLRQVLHIFSYLKYHHNSRIIMNPTNLDIKVSDFSVSKYSGLSSLGSLPPSSDRTVLASSS